MNNLKKYLNNQQIKENLNKEQLLELKELINKQEGKFIENRSKECYLWEIEKRLEGE